MASKACLKVGKWTPPDPLPHWQPLFIGFRVLLCLANQAEMKLKLQSPISQLDQKQRRGFDTSVLKEASVKAAIFPLMKMSFACFRFRGPSEKGRMESPPPSRVPPQDTASHQRLVRPRTGSSYVLPQTPLQVPNQV